MSIWNSGTGYSRRRLVQQLLGQVLLQWSCSSISLDAHLQADKPADPDHVRSVARRPFLIRRQPPRFPQADTCAPSYSGAKRKLANLTRDSATEGMQLSILEQFPTKSISFTPDCQVVFLVIVTTSIRVSCGDWTVLMRTSVFVCIFKPNRLSPTC